MQTNRKSFGTLKSDRYIQVTVMDEWPLWQVICNDLSDDADLKAKSRQMYAKSNTLRQKFHMCSTAVKVKLFIAYFSNVYMRAFWVNYRKTFHRFVVAYNKLSNFKQASLRCSASGMFATDNENSCTCVIRKSIYSLMTWIFSSTNPIVKSIVRGDVYCTSALRNLDLPIVYYVALTLHGNTRCYSISGNVNVYTQGLETLA